MKHLVKHVAVVLGCVSLFALAGCGGGSSSSSGTPSTPTTTSISGVVADGYLVGAKVCLDKNNNKKCDADEPSAITAAGGAYSLNVTEGDQTRYPVLVEVTATVTDEQRPTSPKGYILTSPVGYYQFVSPLTTLIQNQVENTGLTPVVAEATLRNQLGASSSLFDDFKPGSANATAEQKLVYSVAKVIADTIATNKAAIETAVGASNTTVNAVVNLVVQQVMQQLPTVLQQVQSNLVSGVLPDNKVTQVITNSGVTISTSSTTTLQQQLAAAGTQATVSDLIAMVTSGLYSIDRWQSGYINNQPVYSVEYGKTYYTSSNSRINHSSYELVNNSWQAASNSTSVYLTSTGWQAEDSTYGTWDQASSTYTSSGGGQRMKASLVKYDVSGQAFAAYLSNWQGTKPVGSFPAGSEIYRLTFTYLADTYRLSSGWTMCTNSDQNGCTAYATTLNGMISSYSYPNGGYNGSNNIWFQFGPLNNVGTGGTLYLFTPYTQLQQPQLITTSTYQIRTINGVQMLMADARPVGGDYMIFAVYSGKVHGGEYYPANVAMLSQNIDFNATAIRAIATAAGLPALPLL